MYYILAYLPYFIVGLVVWYVMKLKCKDDIRKASLEAYYKGKEDGSEIFSSESKLHRDRLIMAYEKGLIDGYRHIFESSGIAVPEDDTEDNLMKYSRLNMVDIYRKSKSEEYMKDFHERHKRYKDEKDAYIDAVIGRIDGNQD